MRRFKRSHTKERNDKAGGVWVPHKISREPRTHTENRDRTLTHPHMHTHSDREHMHTHTDRSTYAH